jgi:hypothetical protein
MVPSPAHSSTISATAHWTFVGTFDEETKLCKRAVKLNKGSAAMMGILGLMVHEKLGDKGMVVELPIIGTLA